MKKIAFVTTCLLMLSTTMVSCFWKAKLDFIVASMNAECPKVLENGMTKQSVTYENGIVTMNIQTDEINFAKIETDADLFKTGMLIGLQSTETGSFLSILVEEKATLKFVYSVKDKNDSISIDVSPEELAKIEKEGVQYTPVQLLQNLIIAINKSLPEDIGDGMSVVKYEIDGDFLVETISVSDKKDLKELSNLLQEAKETLRGSLIQNPGMQEFFKLCKEADKGYARHFVSEDGKEKIVIELTPSELP